MELAVKESEVKPGFMKEAHKLSSLTVLDVSSSEVRGEDLCPLDSWPKLEHLISPKTTKVMGLFKGKLPQSLRRLRLDSDELTDADMASVARFSNLTFLSLNRNAKITSKGLAALSALPLLELDIDHVQLTPDCIQPLSKIKSLITLCFCGDRFTKADMRLLKQKLPHCQLYLTPFEEN